MSETDKQLPTELELAAYNEADHVVVGIVQGRYTYYTLVKQRSEQWGGETEQDLFFRHHQMPTLPPQTFYARIGYPVPLGGSAFTKAENCVLKYAGVVAEELLCEDRGVKSSEVRIGKQDVFDAEELARECFPEDQQAQQTWLNEAKVLTRKILSDPACWSTVAVVALELELSPTHRLEEASVHSIVIQTLISNV